MRMGSVGIVGGSKVKSVVEKVAGIVGLEAWWFTAADNTT